MKDLERLNLEEIAEKLGVLRNDYRGHGATVSDAIASTLIQEHLSCIEDLLDECHLLAGLSLFFLNERDAEGTTKVARLIGKNPNCEDVASTTMRHLAPGHLVLVNNSNGEFLDLYPLVVFDHPSST